VPVGAHCGVGGARSRGELVVLELPEPWLHDAFALCGAEPSSEVHGWIRLRDVAIERADSQRARRASRLLRDLGSSPALFGVSTPLRVVSRILELVDVAGEVEPGVLKPGRTRRVSAGRGRLLDAIARLRAEPLEGLSLPFLAQRLGMSERQASRVFQAEIGTTFRAWSGDVRLERACALLRETELSIVGVAGETGWSSLAHFNTAFRRREGCTPSAYRARRREGPRP
jgi:AraC-like DNA-binding protein